MDKIFDGLKVLDFSNNIAGPYAAAMLCDFGAEVIKVERPVYGDDTRGYWPAIGGNGMTLYWVNRGKNSVTIDLNDPEGIEIIKKIIADTDVIVEAFRPGVMKKIGLDYENVVKIKKDVIYCSVSAYGQTGKYAGKAGYDLLAQAMSGIMDMTGEKDGPPMKSGVYIGDFIGTLNAFGAISAALYYRQRTGKGQYIDISLVDGLVASHNVMEMSQAIGMPMTRSGNHHSYGLCPYGLFMGKNGQSMIIAAPNDKLWEIFCKAIGKEDYITRPDFISGKVRLANIDKVIELIEGWLSGFDDINDAVKILEDAKIPCCKVMKPHELMDDENLKSRDMIVDYVIPVEGQEEPAVIKTKGIWIKMSETPGKIGRVDNLSLGEANYKVLTKYGLSKERIDQLQDKWAKKAVDERKKGKQGNI